MFMFISQNNSALCLNGSFGINDCNWNKDSQIILASMHLNKFGIK